MPHVVYALFEDAELAEKTRADLTRRTSNTGYDVQPHERHIDANQLPDSATFYGRNLVMATTVGSVFFVACGAVLGIYDVIPGVGPGMGMLLGLICGTVIGIYTGMQAGTRVAKEPIAVLAPQVEAGAVLLTIEVSARHNADKLVDDLDERGADECGIC